MLRDTETWMHGAPGFKNVVLANGHSQGFCENLGASYQTLPGTLRLPEAVVGARCTRISELQRASGAGQWPDLRAECLS